MVVLWCCCKLHVTDRVCFAHFQPPVWNTPHPDGLKAERRCDILPAKSSSLLMLVFLVNAQLLNTQLDLTRYNPESHPRLGRQGLDRSLHLSPTCRERERERKKRLIRLGALSKARASEEVNAALREGSVGAVQKEGGGGGSRRTLRSPDLFTLHRGTEEHRCAVFYAQPRSGPERAPVRPSVATMSAATASIADVSRTDFANTDDGRDRNKSGETEGNCEPNGVQFILELSV